MMKKLILTLILAVTPLTAMAAGSGFPLQQAPVDPFDTESLKRGAKAFSDYCMGCHSAFYMRYNRIAEDLGEAEAWLRDTLIFTRNAEDKPTKVGELMHIAKTDEYALEVFGTKVPDLTLTARAKGADWVYTYLKSFYVDPYKATGMNNTVFPDVSMPNVLWPLQGVQEAVYKTESRQAGDETIEVDVFDKFEIVRPGKMSAEEFDAFTGDLVNFMVYIAEPVQADRRSLGWKVLLFLVVFTVLAYLTKKEYWKDVH